MTDIRALYDALIDGWNRRNADEYAELFEDDGIIVGFDGTQVTGREEIRAHLRSIFADHQTAAYVVKIRDVRFVAPGVGMLMAVAGMIPPGTSDINPATNAVQTLIGREVEGVWRIALFQNTPAQYHGRAGAVETLTEELRAELGR
jgi:uncharacterized protein (TIGR02246 family)